jgi:hypothetical protein
MTQSSARLDMLMADFSGLVHLEDIVYKTLKRLETQAENRGMTDFVRSGAWSMHQFDGYMAEMIRKELGKTLAIVRAKAVQKARQAGAGSAATAVLRRMYKSGKEGNINIAGNRGRISSRIRVTAEPNGGKSGIRRDRSVKPRTKQLREYYGPDCGFILRILENGRDVFNATPEGPTGKRSRATWGKRGAIEPKPFFQQMHADMEQAAQQLGHTLEGLVEKWIEQQFTEATK